MLQGGIAATDVGRDNGNLVLGTNTGKRPH
jgi:hypothetical protein